MIGEVIRRYRKAAKLTQPQLCEILHVDQTHISKIEQGKRKPSVDLLAQLAWVLRIPAGELIDSDGIGSALTFRVGERTPAYVPQVPPPWSREKELLEVIRALEEERRLKVLTYALERRELSVLHKKREKKLENEKR